MSDTTAAPETDIINVPITKAKTTLAIDINAIPADVFREIVLQGAKVVLNRGASKITKETYPEADELKTAALAKANEQLELVMTSKIKFTGGKAKTKASGAVMTEARRLAKALVKDELKRAGIKISHVEASEITKAANLYLESEKGKLLVAKAEANLAEREKESVEDVFDVSKIIHVSEKLVAKAEAKRKAGAGTLSAKQAGKVKARAKPEAQATAH